MRQNQRALLIVLELILCNESDALFLTKIYVIPAQAPPRRGKYSWGAGILILL